MRVRVDLQTHTYQVQTTTQLLPTVQEAKQVGI